MPWKTESGLKDDFYFRVDAASFEEREDIGNQLCLVLAGTDLEDDSTASLIYTCGPGWETLDGGMASHAKKTMFARTTKMGKLVDRITEVLGEERAEALGEPGEAKTWMSLVLHIVAEERSYEFKQRETGETISGTTRDQYPTEVWLSEADWLKSRKAPAKVAPSSQKTESSSLNRLTMFAKSSKTFEAFVEKALEIEDVVNDDELVSQVTDESESGFYATHH